MSEDEREAVEKMRAAMSRCTEILRDLVGKLNDVIKKAAPLIQRMLAATARAEIRDLDRSWRFFMRHPDLSGMDGWLDRWYAAP